MILGDCYEKDLILYFHSFLLVLFYRTEIHHIKTCAALPLQAKRNWLIEVHLEIHPRKYVKCERS